MKTITYNEQTHVLVPREPTDEMLDAAGSIAFAEEIKADYSAMIAAAPQPEPVDVGPVAWIAGTPPHPYDKEWFIAKLDNGQKVVLKALPEEYSYDFRTADDTYYKSYRVKQWMQFPDSEFVPFTHPPADDELRRVAELEAETTRLKLDLLTSYGEAEELSGKVAELEKALKVARDGIDEFLVANDPTEFGCACDLSVGCLCGPCHADKQQQPLKNALAKINEVLKP